MRSMPIGLSWAKVPVWAIFAFVLLGCLVDDVCAARRRTGLIQRLLGRRACTSATAETPVPAAETREEPASGEASPSDARPPKAAWKSLFDGETLIGWKPTPFGGEGDVSVENGHLILGLGSSLTGVNYTGDLPRTNYEVELEAQRLEGIDFFCGLTFPVGSSHCSFIVGGWAGGIVGLSCIDGRDASENETTHYRTFENGRWYRIRVRVTDDRIEAWIDEEQIVYQDIRGRRISTRAEVDPSRPFGLATWETKAAIRNIRLRSLTAEEIASAQP